MFMTPLMFLLSFNNSVRRYDIIYLKDYYYLYLLIYIELILIIDWI